MSHWRLPGSWLGSPLPLQQKAWLSQEAGTQGAGLPRPKQRTLLGQGQGQGQAAVVVGFLSLLVT